MSRSMRKQLIGTVQATCHRHLLRLSMLRSVPREPCHGVKPYLLPFRSRPRPMRTGVDEPQQRGRIEGGPLGSDRTRRAVSKRVGTSSFVPLGAQYVVATIRECSWSESRLPCESVVGPKRVGSIRRHLHGEGCFLELVAPDIDA